MYNCESTPCVTHLLSTKNTHDLWAGLPSKPADEQYCCFVGTYTWPRGANHRLGLPATHPMNCCTVISKPNFAHAKRQLVQCWLIVSISVPSQSNTRPLAPSGSSSGGTSDRRQAGGKTFARRDGAWYDSAYHGQPTQNYRRGTDEYSKLDAGLRSIAEQIGGTVVVVWKGKAFRLN